MGTFTGASGPDVLAGTNDDDVFLLQSGGDDSASGGEGMDGFYFGAALTSADALDGGNGADTLALQGDYSSGLTFGDIRSAEYMVLFSGANTAFGDTAGNRYSYNLTTTDAQRGPGENLTVIATGLLANENVTFNGAAESDASLTIYAGTGVDHLTGGAGGDGFFFGADGNLTGDDRIDGGAGADTVALRGNYLTGPFLSGAVFFQDATLKGVEVLALLSGHTNEYTGTIVASGFSYDLLMADGNVAAGARMDVIATGLGGDEHVYFDGSREVDGSYRVLSGAGADFIFGSQTGDAIYGGLGSDQLTGNGGGDTFIYRSAAESTTASRDIITDFGMGDVIDLGAIDANSLTEGKEAFAFVGTSAFSGTAGELRATATGGGTWLLEGDTNGDSVADLAIDVRLTGGFTLVGNNSMVTAVAPLVTPVFAEVESNDGRGIAQAIDRNLFAVAANPDLIDATLPSATIRGSISTPSDVDFFKVTLNAGERLYLDVDHSLAGGLDAVLSAYGPDGALIGQDDDPDFDDAGSDRNGAYASDPHTTDSMLVFRAQTSGTYTFSVEAFKDPDRPGVASQGSYDLQVSFGPPVSAAQIQRENVDALISGAKWDVTALTYSFPSFASDYPDYGTGSEPYNNFHPLNFAQQNAVRSALGKLSDFSDLSFTEVTGNRSGAMLRYAMSDEPDTAYAFYPAGNFPLGGDAWFRYSGSIYSSPVLGNYAFLTFMHETGHALGLKHGQEFPYALSPDQDTLEYSIMTYRGYAGAPLDGYRNEPFGYPQSYMMYDIAALQKMYGADFTFNSGDSVYRWDANSGQMSINGVGQASPGANRVFLTTWDGGGNDTYDLSNYSTGVTLDLRPGEWTTTSQVQLANLGSGHYARGNVANSLLFNDDPRSLIENGIGGSGADLLIANQAANHLTGNGGADTFRWVAASDSRPGGSADTIDDFQNGFDHIDLSAIDADSRTAFNDAFHWIGGNAFSGTAGELRGEVIGGSAHIFADVDADGIADFELILAHQTTLPDPQAFAF
jgi:serralysin